MNYTWLLSEELEQERELSVNTMDHQKCRRVSALTLRMLLIGMSVKVPAGAAGAAAGAGAAGAAAGVGAAATACQHKLFDLHLKRTFHQNLEAYGRTPTFCDC